MNEVAEERSVIKGISAFQVINITKSSLVEKSSFVRGLDVLNGKIYVADRNRNTIHIISFNNNIVETNSLEKADLSTPDGIVKDVLTPNLLISDSYNHRILSFSPDTLTFQVLTGNSNEAKQVDGPLQDARFYYPKGISVDKNGIIYVAESSHRIRKIDRTTGQVTTVAGTVRGYKNGPSEEAQFDWPCAVEVDSQGNLYIADKNNSCVRFINASNGMVSTLAGGIQKGLIDGPFEKAKFKEVFDLKLDHNERNLWICDSGNKRIRKLDLKQRQVNTLLHTFQLPRGIQFESKHNLLVADASTHSVHKIVLKMPLEWKVAKLLWIGMYKENPSLCNLAKLPRELIFEIISIANDLPDFS